MQIAVQAVLHTGLRKGEAEAVTPDLEQMLGRPRRTLDEFIVEHSSAWRAPQA
jgi:hypothetical protein